MQRLEINEECAKTEREYFSLWMREALQSLSLRLTERQEAQFYRFYEDLIEKNKVMNLTGITEMHAVIVKHFVDSLSIVKAISDLGKKEGGGVGGGGGAGFPGIPMAIMWPKLHFTLMDSLNKRIAFIQEEAARLELKNIEAVHSRAEDLAKDSSYREQYDLCVSRAVANLSTLSEYCLPFIHKDGTFIPFKSGQVEEERRNAKNALSILGGVEDAIIRFSLPEEEGERCLIRIKKIRATPQKYPRKAGLPAKEPLH